LGGKDYPGKATCITTKRCALRGGGKEVREVRGTGEYTVLTWKEGNLRRGNDKGGLEKIFNQRKKVSRAKAQQFSLKEMLLRSTPLARNWIPRGQRGRDEK